jgi:predicted metal-dependent phosphoesterase TrpH
MIDLHLHTTASDGTDTPAELVRACREAGITTMAVTDHDTVAALAASAAEAGRAGIAFVPGIEITAAWRGRDVHVLGYFLDPASPALRAFLEAQIADRIRRAREVGERLAALGAPIDVEALIARRTSPPRSSMPGTRPTAWRPSIGSSAKASPPTCPGGAQRRPRWSHASTKRGASRRWPIRA